MTQQTILRVVSKMLIPYIMLFGLYVQFHGDFGPGGGFQAGVIFAAAMMLYALVFGLSAARRVISPVVLEILFALGVLMAGTARSLRPLQRLSMVAAAVPTAFVANYVRVLALCAIAFQGGAPAAQAWHDPTSYLVYLVALVLFVGMDRWMARRNAARARADGGTS